MASSTLNTFAPRTRKPYGVATTPQTEKAVKGQKKNAAGGYTFKVEDLERVKRFLILGSESNFYTPGAQMTKENAKVIIKVLESGTEPAKQVIDLIVEISDQGRAAKQQPGLFALALAASFGSDESKKYALDNLRAVARTASTLFQFVEYVQQFRGWGRALKRAVSEWYTDEASIDRLAYQVVKYQARNGYTHRDLFRLTHPVPFASEAGADAFEALGKYILSGEKTKDTPKIIKGFLKAKSADDAKLPAVIRKYGLSWEMLPTEALNRVDVWEALLDGNVPLGALIRQLPRLTRIGALRENTLSRVVVRLTDEQELAKARIHPLTILQALKTYKSGGTYSKGDSTWTPNAQIVNALDSAFYLAFKAVVPAGKKTLIGLDVSGSMGSGGYSDTLTPREITAAISLVTVATEPQTTVWGFTGSSRFGFITRNEPAQVTDLTAAVDPRRRLDDVIQSISGLPFGPTDCSLPMLLALQEGLEVETFIILTDNDTYAGQMQPHQALELYRAKTGIPARLVVLSTDANRSTIVNPNDAGSLDIAGYDSAAPSLIANFSRGDA